MKYFLIVLSIMIVGCVGKPPNLDCDNIDSIKATIKQLYAADRIEISSRVIKEEVYFDEIRSVYVTLYNATTEILDFKSLPLNKYQRFENYEEIENGLKEEGVAIFNMIKRNCSLNNFNEVIVVFGKRGDDDPLLYDFIVHYKCR